MKFYITNVSPQYPTHVNISWELEDIEEELTPPIKFIVQRSGSPEGPFEDITDPTSNITSFEDDFTSPQDHNGPNLLSLNRSLYYRIKVQDFEENEAITQPVDIYNVMVPFPEGPKETIGYTINTRFQPIIEPVTLHTFLPDSIDRRRLLFRRKLLREHFIFFKLEGIQTFVLKKRHWGEPCQCKDPLTQGASIYHCEECHGTGWIEGYYNPIETKMVFNEAPVHSDTTPQGPTTLRQTTATLMAFPKLQKDDVLVEKTTNRRWKVQQSTQPEIKRLLVSQNVQVSELSRDSIEYRIPISGEE